MRVYNLELLINPNKLLASSRRKLAILFDIVILLFYSDGIEKRIYNLFIAFEDFFLLKLLVI